MTSTGGKIRVRNVWFEGKEKRLHWLSGEICLEEGGMRLACTSIAHSGKFTIRFGTIANVERHKARVVFGIVDDSRIVSRIGFEMKSDTAAQAMTAKLPGTRLFEDAEAQRSASWRTWMVETPGRVVVTPVLLFINIAAYVVVGAWSGAWMAPSSEALAWTANSWEFTTGGDWWRLISSGFVHYGPVHLILNMLVLYSGGRDLERYVGRVSFLLIYLAGMVISGLASIYFWREGAVVGASGAICAVYGALIAFAIAARKRLAWQVQKALLKDAVMFVVFNGIMWMALARFFSNAAHIAGLIVGMTLGFIIVDRPEARERAPQRRLAAVLVAGFAAGAGIFAIPWSGVNSRQELRFVRDFPKLRERENQVVDRYDAARKSRMAGEITEDAFVALLRSDVATGYDAMVIDLEGLRVSPTSPNRRFRDRYEQYWRTSAALFRAYAAESTEKSAELEEKRDRLIQEIEGKIQE